MNKKIWLLIVIILIIILAIIATITTIYLIDLNRMNNNEEVLFSTWGRDYKPTSKEEPNATHEEDPKTTPEEKPNVTTDMKIVLSLEDEISENTAWCGTFNLIWNDLKNDLAKQDIVFTPQLDVVKNLNKGTFNISHISENSYYKTYGTPSLELKKQIESEIKRKFNETSDILDSFNWENHTPYDYFLYVMLKKEFEFPSEFTKLANGKFANVENVKYFGIDSGTNKKVRNQVNVLYYNSKDDFAIKLNTKSDDEVIITRGNNNKSFGEVYSDILDRSEKYKGDKYLNEEDIVKIPNININLKKDFPEIQNKIFLFSNGDEYKISKALQTIKFELDEKGGKIKSEAGMMVDLATAIAGDPVVPREFIVDNTFIIFLKENNKDLPYFASKISDIRQVQKDI